MSRPIYRRASGLFLVVAGVSACLATVPPQAKCQEKAHRADTRTRDALNKPIERFEEINDPKTTLAEVLDRLSDRHGFTFRINERAFVAEGLEGGLSRLCIAENEPIRKMYGTTLRAVLKAVLAGVKTRSAATFLIRPDCIEITTEAEVRRDLGLPMPKLADDAKNALPVTPLVWEVFRDVSLADALAHVADMMEVTVLIDTRVADKAATKIDATLRNVPTGTAVESLCDMAGLAVHRRHNVYFVTTPENADRLRKRVADEKK